MASGNVEIAGNGSGSRRDATDVQRRQDNRLSMVVEHSTGPSMIIANVSTVTSVVMITLFLGSDSSQDSVPTRHVQCTNDSSQHLTSTEFGVPTDFAAVP